MKSSRNAKTLEEIAKLTNEELLGNWLKFARLISAYENISWNDAGVKARKLYANEGALTYIEEVRKAIKEPSKGNLQKPKEKPVLKLSSEKTIYEKNYERLMTLIPDLEEKLVNYNGEEIYGRSVRVPYMDLVFELLFNDKTGFYISLAHYYEQNGDLVSDPDMEILVNVQKKIVEALEFQNVFKYSTSYADKYDRNVIHRSERKSLNDFLYQWLKNLKNQGHKVKWEDEDSTGIPPVPQSYIKDDYKKTEKEKSQSDVKPSEVKPEEPISEEVKDKEEKKEEAKIISLPKLNKEEITKSLERFIQIVGFRDREDRLSLVELQARINHILDHIGSAEYLITSWDELQKEDHIRLKELNYYRLNYLIPDILTILKEDTESIRLVSDKTKETFIIVPGDDRKKNEVIVGVYQLNGTNKESTLLLKLNSSTMKLNVEVSTGSFFGMPEFSIADLVETDLENYQISILVEGWLKFMIENSFRPIIMHVDSKKQTEANTEQDNQVVPESDPEPEESHKFSKYYVNKDIPYFEKGHVQLTETHKKWGITQSMINKINRNKEGFTLYPRETPMIDNTKDLKADASKQAKGPGVRVSATGRIYPEGRSNRSDATNQGL